MSVPASGNVSGTGAVLSMMAQTSPKAQMLHQKLRELNAGAAASVSGCAAQDKPFHSFIHPSAVPQGMQGAGCMQGCCAQPDHSKWQKVQVSKIDLEPIQRGSIDDVRMSIWQLNNAFGDAEVGQVAYNGGGTDQMQEAVRQLMLKWTRKDKAIQKDIMQRFGEFERIAGRKQRDRKHRCNFR